ncbi:hypothetical protein BV98_002811 [Sphingobium herbicidovorans NBRC 16415]|uniref:Uncharacterized protein n=1 Tax=Sphingobium herbicidovorans (strain ATCC 700291 / DSM 11019 / CCUG 56400 / KCTC 2939 / LMG 18315 / NBRC 16415 / MH) TaxID=1219045 RepID=A0A086P7Q9_SPHHM|nr:hypothetical protein [Sphingobium herbicidovorans]KFG89427.1 hypothetical protein BV98_002811 [Sphingobium herbicidovorans NBRC 16415]
MAADAAGVRVRVLARLVEARAARRRREVADAMLAAGVEAQVEGEAVRLSGRGLLRRWADDLAVREAGRGRG